MEQKINTVVQKRCTTKLKLIGYAFVVEYKHENEIW